MQQLKQETGSLWLFASQPVFMSKNMFPSPCCYITWKCLEFFNLRGHGSNICIYLFEPLVFYTSTLGTWLPQLEILVTIVFFAPLSTFFSLKEKVIFFIIKRWKNDSSRRFVQMIIFQLLTKTINAKPNNNDHASHNLKNKVQRYSKAQRTVIYNLQLMRLTHLLFYI